jgi:hypothetical protein
MMEGEEEEDEWQRQQFTKNSRSLAICQKLQTNLKKLKIVGKIKEKQEKKYF